MENFLGSSLGKCIVTLASLTPALNVFVEKLIQLYEFRTISNRFTVVSRSSIYIVLGYKPLGFVPFLIHPFYCSICCHLTEGIVGKVPIFFVHSPSHTTGGPFHDVFDVLLDANKWRAMVFGMVSSQSSAPYFAVVGGVGE